MRHVTCVLAIILWTFSPSARGDTPPTSADIEKLHATWFIAFDTGDGAAMDKMEMDNLVLVMPNGYVFKKSEPRAKAMKTHARETKRSLSDVAVRNFGDTAVLTGLLTSKSGSENAREITTVVFVKNAGTWKIASAQWTTKTD